VALDLDHLPEIQNESLASCAQGGSPPWCSAPGDRNAPLRNPLRPMFSC